MNDGEAPLSPSDATVHPLRVIGEEVSRSEAGTRAGAGAGAGTRRPSSNERSCGSACAPRRKRDGIAYPFSWRTGFNVPEKYESARSGFMLEEIATDVALVTSGASEDASLVVSGIDAVAQLASGADTVVSVPTETSAQILQLVVPGSIEGTFIAWMQAMGPHAYLLTFIGAILENTALVGVLLPGGIAVLVSSAAGRAADASLMLLIALASVGTVVGACFDWALGRLGVARLLAHPSTGRIGDYLKRRLDDAAPSLARHGWWMMLFTHVIGQGRTALAVAAGASGMPFVQFLRMETPAAILWSAIYVTGGYWLGARMHTIAHAIVRWGWRVALGIAVVGFVVWLVRRQPAQPLATVA